MDARPYRTSVRPSTPFVPGTNPFGHQPAVPGTPSSPGCVCTTPAPLGPFRPRRPFAPPTWCLAPTRRAWHPLLTRLRMYNPRPARAVQATEALRTTHLVPGTNPPCLAPPPHPVAYVQPPPRSGRSGHGGPSHHPPGAWHQPAVPGTPSSPGCVCTTPAPLGPFRPRRPFAPPTWCLAPTRRAWHPLLTRLRMYNPRPARAVQATEALRTTHLVPGTNPLGQVTCRSALVLLAHPSTSAPRGHRG